MRSRWRGSAVGVSATAVEALRGLGAAVGEIELPPLALYNTTASLITRSEGFAIHEKTLRERPQDYGALACDRLTIGAYVRASDMVQAMRRWRMLVEATEAAMAGFCDPAAFAHG
jgi:aspartyl-tRNA(Asn)/glutamyl-tRNA(Gln) amidotransferase subunit A